MQFFNLCTHTFDATQTSPKFFKVHLTISPLLCVCGGGGEGRKSKQAANIKLSFVQCVAFVCGGGGQKRLLTKKLYCFLFLLLMHLNYKVSITYVRKKWEKEEC